MSSTLIAGVLASALLSAPTHPPARAKIHQAMRMSATAYCDKGETDGGVQAQRGIVAADPRVLPMGTTVRIDGLGRRSQTYLVADTGSAVKGRRIDIFMPSCRAAKRFGRRPVTVRAIAPPPGDRR
jgi:3D (Asp-Asp-Asp) domain-containing protein